MELIKILSKNKSLIVITPTGEIVEVKLKEINKRAVKLGFVDKHKATVYRKELWERIQRGEKKPNNLDITHN